MTKVYSKQFASRRSRMGLLFLAHALLDRVFRDVSTIEEIVSPVRPCTERHVLRYKVECLVLRAEVFGLRVVAVFCALWLCSAN
jgi:hypothetical protein